MLNFLFGRRQPDIMDVFDESLRQIAARARWDLTPEGKLRKDFMHIFGFDPEGLPRDRYRKEALLKLATLAVAARKGARDLIDVESRYFQEDYREAVRSYFEALDFLECYDPELTRNIPHWSELPAFLSRWVDGERIRFPPT